MDEPPEFVNSGQKVAMEDQELYQKASKRVKEIKGFYAHLLVYILVNGGFFLLKALVWSIGDNQFGWTPAFFWGICLAIHGIVAFGKNMVLALNGKSAKPGRS